MKKILFVVIVTTFAIACQESKESTDQIAKAYDRKVGERIPLAVANRWANNFATLTASGRTGTPGSVDAAMLTNFIGANENILGVVFHHGLHANGDYRLMMFTIDTEGTLFKSDVLDLSTGEMISKEEAVASGERYSLQHPGTPWYHFFGSDVFAEIRAHDNFNYLDVVRGLNDSDEEQVLLFAYNTRGAAGGRTEGEDVTVYDMSNPCPPCSTNE
jgi:hypothetical protein